MNRIDPQGRHAFVTGGPGRAISDRLAVSGAQVEIWDIQDGSTQAAAAEIGGPVTARIVDPCDDDAVAGAVEAAGVCCQTNANSSQYSLRGSSQAALSGPHSASAAVRSALK